MAWLVTTHCCSIFAECILGSGMLRQELLLIFLFLILLLVIFLELIHAQCRLQIQMESAQRKKCGVRCASCGMAFASVSKSNPTSLALSCNRHGS